MTRLRYTSIIGAVILLSMISKDFFKIGHHIPTLENPEKQISKILIEKSKRNLILYKDDEIIKTYQISLGFTPEGDKEFEGDGKTPVGKYKIEYKNSRSRYHLSLRISYPNDDDKSHAEKAGKSAGGDIMIHGLPNGFSWIDSFHRFIDWTNGCIAVTNKEIEEIWKMTKLDTPIEIAP